MAQTTSTSSRTVIIEGLHKVRDVEQDGWEATVDKSSGLSKVSMSFHEDDTLDELWKRIEVCGFERPYKVRNGGVIFDPLIPAYLIRDHDEVRVVGDDEASTPTTIKISETLMSHSNTHHFVPIEFSIDAHTSQRELKDKLGLSVSFERTPRMPDDNKLHQLPGSLGQFELFSVDAYSERLPNKITDAGGVFFPMWQREAMWINFRSMYQCAVRVFVGRVNAISGRSMEEALDKRDNNMQDYIIIPDQQWLDGICVTPGVVRQFVAMPLGSGYTVEGQQTSKENHGGIQLEITPEMKDDLRMWSYAKQDYILLTDEEWDDVLDEGDTPLELGCKVGDVLRSWPTDKMYWKPFRIQDLIFSEVTEGRGQNITPQNAAVLLATNFLQSCIAQKGGMELFRRGMGHDSHGDVFESSISNDHGWKMFVPYHFAGSYSPLNTSNNNPWDAVFQEERRIASSRSSNLPPLNGGLRELETTKGHGEASVQDVKFQTKDIKAMGLAAGGKLIQDIYKDPYPATTWNHAAACILNVHILDPESCEKVTHVVPQPPPIDVKEYIKSGGHFFVVEEKINERIEGGDFDNVKSVSQMDQHVGITTEPEFDPSKPKMCTTCEIRLCDCIIRPCDHQFCNVCIKRLEQSGDVKSSSQQGRWKCPTCSTPVSHVAGFSAPMNLPGEEPVRTRVPVNVLRIEDGRMRFSSIHNSRI